MGLAAMTHEASPRIGTSGVLTLLTRIAERHCAPVSLCRLKGISVGDEEVPVERMSKGAHLGIESAILMVDCA